MTTQTLRGLNGLDPLHWRGDRTNFTHFNGAFDSLLGGSALSAADMDAYRDFINTLVFSRTRIRILTALCRPVLPAGIQWPDATIISIPFTPQHGISRWSHV